MKRCSSCGAECFWARSRSTGKFMIIERKPVPGGNLTILSGSGYPDGIPRAVVRNPPASAETNAQGQLDSGGNKCKPFAYVDHHVHCPYAHQHRK